MTLVGSDAAVLAVCADEARDHIFAPFQRYGDAPRGGRSRR
ncbi:hypothetical protein ACIQ9Q_32270 [Streptomyces sp. NPDC094438]